MNHGMDLKSEKCKPCEGGISSLSQTEITEFKKQIHPSWSVVDNIHIANEYSFVNYKHTMSVVNKIAALAEEEGHHPVMHVFYAKIVIEIWTHAIHGLSENDFVLASKIDALIQAD
jgi:4a-hydroxytetrahydrobiopterin dehydratase